MTEIMPFPLNVRIGRSVSTCETALPVDCFRMKRKQLCLFLGDPTFLQQAGQFCIHGEHILASAEDSVINLMRFSFPDQILDSGIDTHNLKHREQGSVLCQDQTLRNDRSEHH